MSLRINTPSSSTTRPKHRRRKRNSADPFHEDGYGRQGDFGNEPFDPFLHEGNVARASSSDEYMSRLVKLIPAEAIAVYPFLHSRAVDVVLHPEGGRTALWLPAIVAWMVLLLVIILRWLATRDNNGHAQWGAIAIAAISFMLWVPVLEDARVELRPPQIASTVSQATTQTNSASGTQATTTGSTETRKKVEYLPTSFGIFHAIDPTGTKVPYELREFIPELLLAFWTILIPAFYRPGR